MDGESQLARQYSLRQDSGTTESDTLACDEKGSRVTKKAV